MQKVCNNDVFIKKSVKTHKLFKKVNKKTNKVIIKKKAILFHFY